MKIVMLARLYAPHIGGVEKHVAKVIEECLKEGNRVNLFTLRYEKGLKKREEHDLFTIHRIPFQENTSTLVDKILERLSIWFYLFRHLNLFILADFIHIHDVFFWYWPLRFLLFWKKVYITFHGFEAGTLPTSKAKKVRKLAALFSHGSIAVGGWIEKWYGTKANIITYGAGDCLNRKTTHSKAHTKSMASAVFIGRIAKDTGADVYKKVLSSLPNFKFDIFGEGSKEGPIGDSCDVFPNYDIACVSSYLSIVEAMQSRTLVMAYASNPLKVDYLESHPRASEMIIARSEEELRLCLKRYNREEYQDKIDNAYKWAQQQSWNRVYRLYKKLWGVQ